MTERTLLLRCAQAGRYCVLATDFPSARVFDTATSRLACVVELPLRSRASLAALSLTSVALGTTRSTASGASSKSGGKKRNKNGGSVTDAALEEAMFAAAGLSDGTVLIHDIAKDELIGHVAVSDTHHPIIALSMTGGYLFCLAANSTLFVIDVAVVVASGGGSAAAVVMRLRTQPDASAIAVIPDDNEDNDDDDDDDEESEKISGGGCRAFRLLVAGPTYGVFRVQLHSAPSGAVASINNSSGRKNTAEKLLAFASQGTAVDYAWIGFVSTSSDNNANGNHRRCRSLAAVTASADEGAIRVWDLTTTRNSAASNGNTNNSSSAARCRRTLLCGQRMANISLLDLTAANHTTTATKKENNNSSSAEKPAATVHVLATTFTGAALLWNMGECLLPRVVEAAPLQPTGAFFSSSPSSSSSSSRILYAILARNLLSSGGGKTIATTTTNGSDDTSNSNSTNTAARELTGSAEMGLLLMRGRFALPQFEFTTVQRLVADQETRLNSTSTDSNKTNNTSKKSTRAKQLKRIKKAATMMGLGISPALALIEVAPATASTGDGDHSNNDAASNAFSVLDTVWATNRRRLATKALMAPTEAFAAAHSYHAPSMKDLPVRQLTLEQRLRALSASVAKSAVSRAAAEARGHKNKKKAKKHHDGDDHDDDDDNDDVDDDDEDEDDTTAATAALPSLGLATVPLYQALHANDASAVMELLAVAARSQEGMRASVLSLQLPYALQLVGIISERLGITSTRSTTTASHNNDISKDGGTAVGGGGGLSSVSSRSPLLLWLDALVHYRGMEMYAAQLSSNDTKMVNESDKNMETDSNAIAVSVVSPPKDFVAPVLHQYRTMCSGYDKIAALHGRLSLFNAIRPSEKNTFVNRPRKMLNSNMELARTPAALSGKLDATHSVQDDDLLFPAMFTELRTSKGPHVVRVRSKLAKEKKRRKAATTDRALLKKAKHMARELRAAAAAAAGGGGGLLGSDDDDNNAGGLRSSGLGRGDGDDGDIDLDALEALGLGSSDDDDDDDNDEEDEEDDDFSGSDKDDEYDMDDEGRVTKKSRKESDSKSNNKKSKTATADMLADDGADRESDDDDEGGSQAYDPDAELDSSDAGAEFARDSDDEVHSDILDFSDADGSDSDDDDDSSDDADEGDQDGASSDDDVGNFNPNRPRDDDDNDDDEGDGMGEDMAHLLRGADGDDEDSKRETRKSKRVRTDN